MRWRNLLFILLVALAGCKEEKLALGEPAPQLAAFDSLGHEAKLDAWQGKGVYLNFWSVSCGGCMAEMHTLEKLSQQWGDKLVVVAVNTDNDAVDIAPMLAEHHITYPVVRDQMKITQERYQVIGTPTSFLIDPAGRVIDMHQGARDEQALTATFRKLAGEG